MKYEKISSELEKTGVSVFPGFLSPEAVAKTRGDFDRVRSSGGFRAAGIGLDKELHPTIRSDQVHWLEPDSANPVQDELWSELRLLQQAFNRRLFLGLNDFEGHYAAYPAGGFYRKHVDCFQANNDRLVSIVIYLNPDWKAEDGGRLRLYHGPAPLDIDPVGGTLICFLSREVEHEVMISHAPRASFSGWFKSSRI